MKLEPRTLKQIRDDLGLKLVEFGAKIDYDVSTVQGYEAGKPSEKYLRKICEVFGIEREAILVPESRYPVAAQGGSATLDAERREMSPQEFRDAADRFAVECHRRGHRLAARALMDLVDALDKLSGDDASAPKSAKVSQAVADLAKVRPGKPTT